MRVKNWKKFQHFKDRRPPWIKLHREILDQRDIMTISTCSFRLLTCLWLLASEDDNLTGELPDLEDISFRLRMPVVEIIPLLQELTPWLDDFDINAISARYQDGLPETEAYKPEAEKPSSTTTRAQDQLTAAVEENQDKLKTLFPEINLPVATEKLLNHYRESPTLIDPYATVLKWFQNEFPNTKPPPQTTSRSRSSLDVKTSTNAAYWSEGVAP